MFINIKDQLKPKMMMMLEKDRCLQITAVFS